MRARAGLAVAVLASAVLLPGCGGGDGPLLSRTLSCQFPGDFCDTLTATVNDTQEGELGASCVRAGGTFLRGACPTGGMLAGTCHYGHAATVALGFDHLDAVLVESYDALAWTPVRAQASCEAAPAGTWSP